MSSCSCARGKTSFYSHTLDRSWACCRGSRQVARILRSSIAAFQLAHQDRRELAPAVESTAAAFAAEASACIEVASVAAEQACTEAT